MLSGKINEPTLLVAQITSLDDAIDMAHQYDSSLLATYLFAEPRAAKYLSQFISADISLVNHIDPHLLGKSPL